MAEEKALGYIYKTTNLVNGKIYIGQHRYNPKTDKNYLGTGVILLQAISKYGKNNFKKEIIEECYSNEELNQKEVYYIKSFDSTNPKIGYNIELGGNAGPVSEKTRKKISQTHFLLNKTRDHSIFIANLSKEAKTQISIKAKGRKRIHKGDLIKYIKPEELESFLNQGWELGLSQKAKNNMKNATGKKTLGRKHIHKGNSQKLIKQEEIIFYLSHGWQLGYSKKSIKNIKKGMKK